MRAALFVCAMAMFGVAQADIHPPMLVTEVAANRDTVMFVWAGQLWSVPSSGGPAHRVFDQPAEFRNPCFSPDGTQLAFGKLQGGDVDLYVMPAAGGEPKQVTDHPKSDLMRSWAPDGDLIFLSARERDGAGELYKQGLDDPIPMRFPIPIASQGSMSPDGSRLAYVPSTFFGSLISRRAYRGGQTGVIHILDLKTLGTSKITKDDHNSVYPMWVGDRIYYLSDSRGSFNLAVYDLKSKRSAELTDFVMKGIVYAAYSSGQVAYVRDGHVFLYNVDTRKISEVPITIKDEDLKAPVDERAARQVAIAPFLQWAGLSPDGKRVVIESRGDIWLKPVGGVGENLTKTPAIAERTPAISPDGKTVAYFTDASGEYQLAFRDLATGETRQVAIEEKPTYYRELTWSQDSKRVAFSDLRLNLWSVEAATGRVQKADSSPFLAQEFWHPAWDQAGRLVYSKAHGNGVRTLYSWDPTSGRPSVLTDGYTPAEYPAVDGADQLRYVASASVLQAPAMNVWALQSSIFSEPLVAKQIASLGVEGPALFSPTQKDIIDLKAGKAGVLFAMTQNWGETPGDANGSTAMLYRIDAKGRTWDKLASDIDGFEVSADGSTLLYTDTNANIWVLPADTAAPEGDKSSAAVKVDLGQDKVDVDPSAEWRELYQDAFHMMRDRFYDANHHGQNIDALQRHYAEYLPSITRRSDLNTLLLLAFGEVSISHLRMGGGDSPRPSGGAPQAGLLGADWTIENGRYRVAKIHRQSDVLVYSPLVRPILPDAVSIGSYLMEVDGQAVTADKSLNSYFRGKAGRATSLKFSPSSDGANAFEVTATPVPGENTLRMLAWAEENRRKVEQMTGGRIGYVYIPGYDFRGYANFARALFAAKGKDALVIDQRFNGGGITSDSMIQALLGKPILAYEYPYGNDFTVPAAYVDGPKVLIINDWNGSAAETFGLMFKNAKLGTVVGTRTYGAGIGGGLTGAQLIDGGSITIPNRASYNPLTGSWEIENDGVRPDVEVEWTPKDYAAGRDTQLEAAVKIALEQARTWKKTPWKRPKPPVHPGGTPPKG